MNRRNFLRQVSVFTAGYASQSVMGMERDFSKLPRTIYSNDTTHILSCQRPEVRSATFTDELLRDSIREAKGVDAHFLQPGLGWMPWWPSKIYSAQDHYTWLREKHGVTAVPQVGKYLLQGGDMLRTLVDTCQEMGVAPFLSYRLNDGHHVRQLAEALKSGKPDKNFARHYWDNYEKYRIGPDIVNWDEGVFDWSIPEVRDYKFSLIEEACSNYDLAGLELDFMRHRVRFGPDTALDERIAITNKFVRRIRKMLDRTAADRGLPRRWLCIRVPANAVFRREHGVDLTTLVKSGVDMINLSHSYFTWQDDSVARARKEAGTEVAVYLEMSHTTMTGKATAGSGTQPYHRTTEEQFYTTTRLAYDQGATGVVLFNFPYYRYHVTDTVGPFHEPPFHVLPKLKDPRFLKKQDEWYFLTSGRKDPALGERRLPAILQRNETQSFILLTLPQPKNRADGCLRLRSDEEISDRKIEIRFNGKTLNPIAPVTVPLPHPYTDTWIGEPEELACFEFPASVTLRKSNIIEITVKEGIRVRLTYLDVTIPK